MAERYTPRVLSIAGTDPSGGAGLIADIKSITALGGYGMGVVTAVTVQNTQGVRDVHPVPVDTVVAQLDAVADDVRIDAVKIGMLGRVDLVEAVGEWLSRRRPANVVLDPVMVATTGSRLSSDAAASALLQLARIVDLVTPNVPELGVMAGQVTAEDLSEVERQARDLAQLIGTPVLATTGDLTYPAGGEVAQFGADVLACAEGSTPDNGDAVRTRRLAYVRSQTASTHGTGCSLSSALATAVAGHDGDWLRAYRTVRPWLDGALEGADDLAVGHGSGPLDHNWFLHR